MAQSKVRHHHINHEIVTASKVNSEGIVTAVKRSPGNYLIYSGPSGTILKDEILNAGKHIFHVHPGWLPEYRGSTTVYYALLAREEVGCSLITMEKEVDTGPVFLRRKYRTFGSGDLDHVFDPAIRAATLLDFFRAYYGIHPAPETRLKENEGVLYYIIHPVLKHLAILATEARTA